MSNTESEPETLELLEELQLLRAQVRELEAALDDEASPSIPAGFSLRREERMEFGGEIQFTGDFNLLEGRALNLSTSGICFELTKRVQFPMCFEVDGKEVRRNAFLSWIQRAGGTFLMGFEFDYPLAEGELPRKPEA